jgi:hypothetical protein
LKYKDTKFYGKEASLKGTYRGRDIDDAYTVGGKKNGIGGRIEGSGLFELVSSQPDFVNEVTLLQYFTEQRSLPAGCQLMLIRSPKCHPELAGEGIEYDWSAAKQWYRRQKLAETSAHLLERVVKERKSHRTVSQDGSWVEKMLKRMKEQPLNGDVEG